MTAADAAREQQHRHLLEVLVAAAAPRCKNLAELLGYLPGAYPAEAAEVLGSLADRLIDDLTSRRLQASGVPPAQPAVPPRQAAGPAIALPDPHPLDFDWRWTAQTAASLVARCTGTTGPGDTIALLGTPTLVPLAAAALDRRRWLLLEASTATISVLATRWPHYVQPCDLITGELPDLGARVVVADPPWYPEHTRAFLWASARLSIPGATVLLAQPALATRPGILDERAGLLAYAHSIGLELAAICPGTLAYTCPPFEQRALAAAGLSALVPSDWRHGDLIELRRTTAPPGPRPHVPGRERWDEVTVGRARLRFRIGTGETGQHRADPRLIPLVPGDILGSVSRRDPIRAHVRVWTAGNRVFGCEAPALLKMIAASIAAGTEANRAIQGSARRPLHADDLIKIRAAAAQLHELIHAEHQTAPAASSMSPSYQTSPPQYRAEDPGTRSLTLSSDATSATEQLIAHMSRSLRGAEWTAALDRLEAGTACLHLAILTEPFYSWLMDGTKTIESRFSRVRCAPYGALAEGDIIADRKQPPP